MAARVDRRYDVPLLAGASNDGKTLYIDRRVPKRIKVGGKMLDPSLPLRVHEETEHRLMTKKGLTYDEAHEIATKKERAWIERAGFDWKRYTAVISGHLSSIEHQKPTRPPPDLYLKPYPPAQRKQLKRAEGGRVTDDPQGFADGGSVEPVRESVKTLTAQRQQIVDGHRRVQMYPGGDRELPLVEGLRRIKTKNGDVFHFNPKKIKASEIVKASNAGRENELLDLGPYTKQEAIARAEGGEIPVSVTERDADGTELRAAAGTHGTAKAQLIEMNGVKSPGSTVAIENPAETIARRHDDPFEAAAHRVRQNARPGSGRRQEGAFTNFMEKVAPATLDTAGHMAQGLGDMVAAPGRALQGGYSVKPEVPGQWSEGDQFRADTAQSKMSGDATGLALSLLGTGTPFAQPGSAGIFGGKLAQTADKAALARAEELAAKGAPREQIWSDTGWFQGPDKQWRFEIPDNKSVIGAAAQDELRNSGMTHGKSAGLLWHGDLYAAYPELRNMDAASHIKPTPSGSYMSATVNGMRAPAMMLATGPDPGKIHSVALHEMQHAVQASEGFPRGSSPEAARQVMSENTGNPIVEQLRSAIATGQYGMPGDPVFMEAARKLLTLERQVNTERATDLYRRHAGEVEARNVQTRQNMTPEERRATPPWKTEDVPVEQQIVRMSGERADGGPVHMADGGAPAFDPSQPFEEVKTEAPAFDPSKPFEPVKDAAPATSTATDVAKSGGIGVAKGALGVAGMGGDARELITKGAAALSQAIGYDVSPEVFSSVLKSLPLLQGPSSREAQSSVENFTGKFYEPKTTAGEYAQTVGQFAPAAVAGPGGLTRRAMQTVLPALASETGGQLAKGSALEPAARITGAIAGGAPTMLRAGARAVAAPAAEEIRDASRAAYTEARNLGLEIRPQPIANLANRIEADLAQQGLTIRNVPETYDVIRTLQNPPRGSVMRATDFENARQELVQARNNSTNRREAVAANVAINRLDDYLANIPAGHVVRGDAARASELFREARGNWAAASRADMVGGKLELGDLNAATAHSGQNIDNSTRQAVKQLIRPDKNGRTLAEKSGFSADEIAVMNEVARGTTGGNVARFLGKLAPTGLVSVGMHAAMAGHSGGLSVPLSAAALLAKRIGDASTARNAARLDEMVRARSPLAQSVAPPAGAPQLTAREIARLNGLYTILSRQIGREEASNKNTGRIRAKSSTDD